MVEILDPTHRFPAPERLHRAVARLLAELGLDERELTVVLLDDAAMHERNRLDRGVDAPTDVLSYPTAEPGDVGMPQVPHLGDVLVGLDVARRQAAAQGQALEREVLMLVAHGITHLRGYDHPTEASWKPFRAAQTRILELDDAP